MAFSTFIRKCCVDNLPKICAHLVNRRKTNIVEQCGKPAHYAFSHDWYCTTHVRKLDPSAAPEVKSRMSKSQTVAQSENLADIVRQSVLDLAPSFEPGVNIDEVLTRTMDLLSAAKPKT